MLGDMAFGRSRHEDPVRITTAGINRADEIDSRVRGYLISMSIRVACFGAAVAVGPGWLRWVLMAGAVFLPYVAVVMANATDQRDGSRALRTAITAPGISGPGQRHSIDSPTDLSGDDDDDR